MRLFRYAISTIAVGVLGVVAASAAAASGSEQSIDQDDLVPILSDTQGADDRLPAASDIAASAELIPESIRLAAESASARYWAAVDGSGNLCVIAGLDDSADGHDIDAEIMGASCADPIDFYQFGASLRLTGAPGSGIVVHLLAPDVSTGSLPAGAEVTRLPSQSSAAEGAASLVSMDLDVADSLGEITLERTTGETVVLRPMSGA